MVWVGEGRGTKNWLQGILNPPPPPFSWPILMVLDVNLDGEFRYMVPLVLSPIHCCWVRHFQALLGAGGGVQKYGYMSVDLSIILKGHFKTLSLIFGGSIKSGLFNHTTLKQF